jgi:hypothetical protein
MDQARTHAQARRQRTADAESGYGRFLEQVATPVVRQLAQALKAEGYPFTVFTPSAGLRLSSDHGRDDYIELSLDTTGGQPQVMGRVSRVRGSRTLNDERPIVPGRGPGELSDQDVLTFFLDALSPWLER